MPEPMPAAGPMAPARPEAGLVVGLGVAAVGLATTLPLPLYGLLSARGGYGAGALALAFACYAAALIAASPLLGPLPDRIGRKPCVLLGVGMAALSTLALTIWPTIPALALARAAQGVGMGCVTGAAAAWAAELAGGGAAGGRRAAGIIAAATIGSFAAGGVATLTSIAAWPDWVPPPTFALHLVFCAAILALTARLPETLAAPRGPWLSRPAFPRGTLATTLAILPGWGSTGTVLTSVQAAMAEAGRPLMGPLAACGMMLVGLGAQRLVRGLPAGRAVRIGLAVLVAGGGLVVLGVAGAGMPALLAGAALVGVGCYAFVYPGGLAAVAEAASGEDRARAVAGYFVVAHLGFSAVPLAAGLAVDGFGATAALGWGWAVLAVAALGLGLAVRRG